MSAYDMAPVIGNALGCRVRAIDMPWWMFSRAARAQGVATPSLASLRHYVEDHKQGAFAYGAPNDVVGEVTGAPANLSRRRLPGSPGCRSRGGPPTTAPA